MHVDDVMNFKFFHVTRSGRTSVNKTNVQFNYNFLKIKVVSVYVCVISVGELH